MTLQRPDAVAPEVVCGNPSTVVEVFRGAPPWGADNEEYEVEVERLLVQPPLSKEQRRYEAFVDRALDADSTYFQDGEPPMPVWPDPVPVTCEQPSDDGVCASTRFRVRGSWHSPAAMTCERGHTLQDTKQTMREVIIAAVPVK